MPGAHALLSPSGAHMWLYCTRSARLQEQFPETTSPYAKAGTLAHAIAELKVRRYIGQIPNAEYNSRMRKLKADPNYDKSMDGATEVYLDYLTAILAENETKPFVTLETRVSYEDYVPGGYGRADCILIAPPKLYVVDYKNGSGVPVEAEWNPQMMLYGLGALSTFRAVYGDYLKTVRLAIVQPNAGGVKEWELPVVDLKEWGERFVMPRAWLAANGQGDFAPSESRCRFCRAKAVCTARANHYLSLGNYATPDWEDTLTSEQISDVITKAEGVASWVTDLKDHALKAILAGGNIPGYKVVEGRSNRAWTDLDKAFATLQQRGVPEAILWERKPVTPPALEKAMGKKDFASASEGLIEKKPGKPTLVPKSDKRKPYNKAQIAFGGGKDD